MLLVKGKSFADFPQIEQLIENDKEDDFMTLEEVMEVGRQYEQLSDKQKEIVDVVLNRLIITVVILFILMDQVVQIKRLYIQLSLI